MRRIFSTNDWFARHEVVTLALVGALYVFTESFPW